MTWDVALESIAAHPHAWRIRELCADDSDPERRDAWRLEVVRMARGEPPAPRPARVDYGDPAPAGGCGSCP